MSSDSRFSRMLRILTAIQAKPGMNVTRLADACEVSERTIYRDLDILRQSGVPIYHDNGYRLIDDFFLPPIQLTLAEGMALALSVKNISGHRGVPYALTAKSALDKITAVLDGPVKAAIGTGQANVLYDGGPLVDYADQHKLFSLLEKARSDCRTVELDYHSLARRAAKRRMVDPYGFVYKLQRWYLVAYCHWRREVKMFRVDRAEGAVLTDRTFVKPAGFSLDAYMGDAWRVVRGETQKVVICFQGEGAMLIKEGRWHPSQKLKDAGAEVELTVEVASPSEMLPWILSFGGDARIIEPKGLAKQVRAQAGAVLSVYK